VRAGEPALIVMAKLRYYEDSEKRIIVEQWGIVNVPKGKIWNIYHVFVDQSGSDQYFWIRHPMTVYEGYMCKNIPYYNGSGIGYAANAMELDVWLEEGDYLRITAGRVFIKEYNKR